MNDFEVCINPNNYVWDDDSIVVVRADNHMEAAEIACDKEDCLGDYTVIRDGGAECVLVRSSVDPEIKRFKVYAEYVSHYNATKL